MIRPAADGDVPAIAAIWNQIIRETTITFTTAEKTHADIEGILGSGYPVLMLEDGSGFATYGPFRSGPGYARTMEHSIHLAPGARGQGRGMALLTALEAAAVDGGAAVFIAAISGENATAQRFHARAGYAQVARLPKVGWKFGRWHDLVLMQKFLP
ncbi:MAG: N-acetyltransferase family protein [Pseudomonadota bacterium]